jgi:hypothetical protein
MARKYTQAQAQAVARYDEKNTKQYHLKLNRKTDAEIIAWLDGMEGKQTYIKSLIAQDMKERRTANMIIVFEGYTRTDKKMHAELDPDTGILYIVYEYSGRRIRYNEEYYTEESDFGFLLNDFRKA